MTPTWIRKKITHRGNKYPPRAIGIEIEVEGRNLPKAIFQNWVIHDDGSLRGDDNAEYVLREPMSRPRVETALTYLEEQFRDAESRIAHDSDRTSVHVHLNVQDKTWVEIFTFWTLWTIVEDLSYELCGPERRGNLFCLRLKDCEGIVTAARTSFEHNDYPFQANDYRYAGVNLTSVFKFGSIEFRGMHGTVDKKEILRWVDFLLLCQAAAERFDTPHEVIQKFSEIGVNNFLDETLRLTPEMVKILRANPEWREMLWEGMRLAQDVAWLLHDWGSKGEHREEPKKSRFTDAVPDTVTITARPRPTHFQGLGDDGDRVRRMQRDLQRQQVQEMQRQLDQVANPPVIAPGWEINPMPEPVPVRPFVREEDLIRQRLNVPDWRQEWDRPVAPTEAPALAPAPAPAPARPARPVRRRRPR